MEGSVRIRTVIAMLAMSAVLTVARPASAQEKGSANFSAGYSNLTFFNPTDSLKAGWLASVGVGISKMAAVVAEVGGHYESGFKLHTFQGGLRFSSAKGAKATPFFQVVTGLSHDNTGIAANSWTFTPGAGVDIKAGKKCAVRGQADWMLFRNSGVNSNTLRVSGSLVFNMSKK